jgi:LPS export ABC transporter protein LptC
MNNIAQSFRGLLLFIIISGSLVACQPDVKIINELIKEVDYPTVSEKNIEMLYTDSAKMKVLLKSPILNMYSAVENPYYEAPQGITVYFYNSLEQAESSITSNYAIFNEKTQIWEARYNVIVKNLISGEELHTEQLFWNQKEARIYSDVFTKIVSEDGTYFGDKGFESDQSFNKLKLKGSGGSVNIQDEYIEEKEPGQNP